ncbi:APC family permease [Sulfobacillus thermosulfidooxidans]|uniref:APC family permease n=1 Tax=Sulfobacillus thermosulfidooxidans TaxID=28034 RepID=UPI0002FC6932|nr:APC family permease [Sulfobacillus thermosulfidooxidans]
MTMEVKRRDSLESNVLGPFDAIIMAIAGSAPAYSIAASTAVLVAAVGSAGPAALLYCGIPMFGIVWAFMYLGRTYTNAGASYAWVGRSLHPALGYMAGWALIVSATLFMVAGSLPAGSITLTLVNPHWANNVTAVTIMGSIWFVVMAIMVLIGIRITSRVQWIMSTIEIVILLLFVVLALIHADHSPHIAFSLSWFGLSRFHGLSGFAAGALVAAFYYWGWDVSANLNEETKNAKKLPGQGGLWGVVVIFLLFEIFTVIINMTLSAKVINANSVNVLSVLGQTIWPGIGGTILSIAVMLSTIATLETSLIQVTRSLFAMGRDRTLPHAFASIHPRWHTPWIATIVVGIVALVLFVFSNFVQSVSTVMTDSISAIGLQIAIYYGLAGIAVVVAYRALLFRSLANAVFIGLWPLLGSAFMFWILFQSLGSLGASTVAIGLGTMALGLIPMTIYWVKGSPYFSQKGLIQSGETDGIVEVAE